MNHNIQAQPQIPARVPIVPQADVPPTCHALKPHHLHLLRLFLLVFYKYAAQSKIPSAFWIQMYRFILVEVAEVKQPASHSQLVAAVEEITRTTAPHARSLVEEFKKIHTAFKQQEDLVIFFQQLTVLFVDTEDEELAPLSRRSIFGFFGRRCFVSFVKLSYEAVNQLLQDYHKWVAGELIVPSRPGRKDALTNSHNIFKTQADKKQYAQGDSFASFEKAKAVGDEVLATENLRRFFEQRFNDSNDSGVRQHALLNIASLHYQRHEYLACHKFLAEAINISRTNNDRVTLQYCVGLEHRLPPLQHARTPIINEVQPDLHPLEVLYDVKKLMQQQPLSACFEKIVESIGVYDHWMDARRESVDDTDQWGQHAVQSDVWGMLGCPQLSAIEENIVTAFTGSCSDDNNRLVVTAYRANRHARQGKYQEAIAMLLHPDVWSGLSLIGYHTWASEIWYILVLRASRREQHTQFREFLMPKRPSTAYAPREFWFGMSAPLGSIIRDPLYDVITKRECNEAHSAVEPLLTALWHAEFQQRYALYRPAVILLADVGLEFGMTKWSRRLIDEIMPQIITGDDLELRGFACFTLARCIIAAGESTANALHECLPYLHIAEKDYTTLEAFRPLQEVQFLISVVYHNLGMQQERDAAAQRHRATDDERLKMETTVVEDWITEVWDLVVDVGAALADR